MRRPGSIKSIRIFIRNRASFRPARVPVPNKLLKQIAVRYQTTGFFLTYLGNLLALVNDTAGMLLLGDTSCAPKPDFSFLYAPGPGAADLPALPLLPALPNGKAGLEGLSDSTWGPTDDSVTYSPGPGSSEAFRSSRLRPPPT
jgi:hypothetical protein